VRQALAEAGRPRTIACVTRGIVHRAGHAAMLAAMDQASSLVLMMLLDPALDRRDRGLLVRCNDVAAREVPGQRPLLWAVPLPQRSGADDVLMAAVVAANAGCTDLLWLGDALEEGDRTAAAAFAARLGMAVVEPAPAPVAGPDGRTFAAADERRLLDRGERLPEWYTFPAIAEELAHRYPPAPRRGFTVFFTGLSGSGKSTIANAVRHRLEARTGRPVTLLDGDLVRQHLSSELGFSRRDRDLNIRRIGFVASEITRHGGMAICAPIAPYESVRRDVRAMIEPLGGFVLVFVDTPLEVCEARDRKGLYAKARAGLIAEFTGVSDPYEPPLDADVVIRTAEEPADRAAERVIAHLEQRGFLARGGE
jgi:sulfate adenylyltransferase